MIQTNMYSKQYGCGSEGYGTGNGYPVGSGNGDGYGTGYGEIDGFGKGDGNGGGYLNGYGEGKYFIFYIDYSYNHISEI